MTVNQQARLQPFGKNLFIAAGDVNFYGVPIQTRMVVARLNSGSLWVWSPLLIDDELASGIDQLGPVAHIVAPNKIHNQGLDGFAARYPEAELWAPPGLPDRRPELAFAGVLDDTPHPDWANDFDQRVTDGNVFFSEAIFFHRSSRTLIVADLIENITTETLPTRSGRAIAKAMRLYGRLLPSPEFRLYTTDATATRAKLDQISAWPFQRILLAHGDLITENAHAVFETVAQHLCNEVSARSGLRSRLYQAFAKYQ
ncbi:MAG: hypothetical protein ACI8TX_002707 [Hyphomicrobiaceae bacterium]|jgi:hypothetical protein